MGLEGGLCGWGSWNKTSVLCHQPGPQQPRKSLLQLNPFMVTQLKPNQHHHPSLLQDILCLFYVACSLINQHPHHCSFSLSIFLNTNDFWELRLKMPETWREKKALGTTFHALSRGHCWNKIQDTLGAGRFYTAEQENYPGKATLFIVIQLFFFFCYLDEGFTSTGHNFLPWRCQAAQLNLWAPSSALIITAAEMGICELW